MGKSKMQAGESRKLHFGNVRRQLAHETHDEVLGDMIRDDNVGNGASPTPRMHYVTLGMVADNLPMRQTTRYWATY